MTIYLEDQLLLNLIVDYLLLLLTGRLMGVSLHRGRLVAGSLFGAVYSAACLFPALEWLTLWPVKLAAGGVMMLLAYGGHRKFFRLLALFFGLACGLGGCVLALALLSGGVTSGGRFVPLSLTMVLLWSGISWLILNLAFRGMAKHSPRELVEVELTLEGRQTRLTALRDSGNTLVDPVDGGKVLVVEWQELLPLAPELEQEDAAHPCEGLARLGGGRRWRLIPYRAVGTSSGLLLALRVDELRVNGREGENRLVALSPGGVSDGGGYSGLIGTEG